MVLFRKRKRERCANGKTDLVLLFPGFEALARWVASRKAKTEARQVSRQEVQRFSAWHFKVAGKEQVVEGDRRAGKTTAEPLSVRTAF